MIKCLKNDGIICGDTKSIFFVFEDCLNCSMSVVTAFASVISIFIKKTSSWPRPGVGCSSVKKSAVSRYLINRAVLAWM